jgi:hypothetical protein
MMSSTEFGTDRGSTVARQLGELDADLQEELTGCIGRDWDRVQVLLMNSRSWHRTTRGPGPWRRTGKP